MSAVKLTDGIYSVGIQNPNMRVFDIVMQTDSGTTYNSYIVRGSEKTALIETCHEGFFEQYVQNIQEVCDPKEIDYIVMNHNEPDHSGAMAKLLELMPNAKLVASIAGANYLRNITNRCDLDVHKVKDGEEIDLGGKTLTFISAPNLHWPDSMFTYVKEDNVLFTCDFLGCHYCEPYTFDYNVSYPKAYDAALKLYYGAIFGPFASYVRKGLEKITALPQQPDLIRTGGEQGSADPGLLHLRLRQHRQDRRGDPRGYSGGKTGCRVRHLRHHRARHGRAARAGQPL